MECRQQLLGVTQTLPGNRAHQGIPAFTRNQQLNPKTSEKTPPKTQNSESGDVSCSIWIYCCFLGPFFGGSVALGRQEKVKFYITLYLLPCSVISPPEGSHLDGDGGSVGMAWISTWTQPRAQGLPHGDGEGLAAGKCLWVLSLLRWDYHYWGGFIIIGVFTIIFEFPNINCQGPLSCLQGSGSARGARGTPTHMETAENEQDAENIPKSHPKHLRHSKPRQNDPVSNIVCKGEIHSCVEEKHRGSPSPGRSPSSLSDPSFWASRWEVTKFSWTRRSSEGLG